MPDIQSNSYLAKRASSCNSFSWLSGPSGLLSLSCSQEGCLHRTNTFWIWATMTLLQQISDILAQSSWAQKKNILGCCLIFFCHLPYLATPSLCDKNMILSRTKLGWQLTLHQSWDRLIFPHETLSIYGADHLPSRKNEKNHAPCQAVRHHSCTEWAMWNFLQWKGVAMTAWPDLHKYRNSRKPSELFIHDHRNHPWISVSAKHILGYFGYMMCLYLFSLKFDIK